MRAAQRTAAGPGKHPARLHMTTWLENAGTPEKNRRLISPITVGNLPHAEVTLAEALKERDYLTALVGKWHLGEAGYYPETQGFDVNIGGTLCGTLNNPIGGITVTEMGFLFGKVAVNENLEAVVLHQSGGSLGGGRPVHSGDPDSWIHARGMIGGIYCDALRSKQLGTRGRTVVAAEARRPVPRGVAHSTSTVKPPSTTMIWPVA